MTTLSPFCLNQAVEVQVTLYEGDIDKHKDIFQLGKVYEIAKLRNMGENAPVQYAGRERMKFDEKTHILRVLDDCPNIPKYNFRQFIPFSEVPRYATNDSSLIGN